MLWPMRRTVPGITPASWWYKLLAARSRKQTAWLAASTCARGTSQSVVRISLKGLPGGGGNGRAQHARVRARGLTARWKRRTAAQPRRMTVPPFVTHARRVSYKLMLMSGCESEGQGSAGAAEAQKTSKASKCVYEVLQHLCVTRFLLGRLQLQYGGTAPRFTPGRIQTVSARLSTSTPSHVQQPG